MRKPYQIDRLRAVKDFERFAGEGNRRVQLMLPLASIAVAMRKGVGDLVRQVGLQLLGLIMEQEVEHVVGERYRQQQDRGAYRWGKEGGYCILDGQKVPLQRCRVRKLGGGEVPLGSYELFQREDVPGRVWQELMAGLSTRNYSRSVRKFAEAYGIEKSAVSEQFIEASRHKLKELLERRLDDARWAAILIDGTPYNGQQFIVALGIASDGHKRVLGLRQGATENETVVNELLKDLQERGVDFTQGRLYILDGARALSVAVRKYSGDSAVIQRCQLHKRWNVLRHLPEEYQPEVERKLVNAWGMFDYAEAKRALERVHRELLERNPSAARSLEEGLEETLTVHRLKIPELLRKTLFSTNPIDSLMSRLADKCDHRIKRWREGDMALRWVASGLLHAESRFRRVAGYKEMPKLLQALDALGGKKAVDRVAKAS